MGAAPPLEGGRRDSQRSTGGSPCEVTGCVTCRKLRAAAVDLAARGGIQAATSEAIARLASVPAGRAAEHYPTLDSCLTAAYDDGTTHFRRVTARALGGSGSWQERLRAAADATVAAFAARPELARFCVLEAWRSDLPMLRACRLTVRRRDIEMMAAHRGPGAGDDLPELRLEMLVGAGHHAVSEELERDQGDPDSLRERLDQLIEVLEPAAASPTG